MTNGGGHVMDDNEYPLQVAIILILLTLITCAAVIRHPAWFGEPEAPPAVQR